MARGGAQVAKPGRNRGSAFKEPTGRGRTVRAVNDPNKMPRTSKYIETVSQGQRYLDEGVSAFGQISKKDAQGGAGVPKGQS